MTFFFLRDNPTTILKILDIAGLSTAGPVGDLSERCCTFDQGLIGANTGSHRKPIHKFSCSSGAKLVSVVSELVNISSLRVE